MEKLMKLWDLIVWNQKLKIIKCITYKMETYCLKCKKDTKTYIQKFRVLVMVNQWYYQNMQYAVVKSQDLLKTKKQKVY